MKIIFIFISTLFLNTTLAHAQCSPGSSGGPSYTCLTPSDVDKVFEDLTSAFAPAAGMGAQTLGKVFGVELGLVISASEANNTEAVVQQYDSSMEVPLIPMAGIVAAISLPNGIGITSTFIPKVEFDENSFQSFSLGGQWNITEMFPLGMIHLAIKANILSADAYLEHSEDTGTVLYGVVTEKADFDMKMTEFGALASLNLRFFEPYLGISTLKSTGGVYAEGSATGPASVPTVDEDSDSSGVRAYVGALFKLPGLRIGAEISNYRDINRASLKLSFKL